MVLIRSIFGLSPTNRHLTFVVTAVTPSSAFNTGACHAPLTNQSNQISPEDFLQRWPAGVSVAAAFYIKSKFKTNIKDNSN